MAYKISEDIRIRICEDKCFLINIKNNSIFMVEKKTFEYLQEQINKSTDLKKIKDAKFISFLDKLQEKGIIRYI